MEFLGIDPKNLETPVQKNLCTPMFIATLFTVAKCWKQSKCQSGNDWMRKLWYISTMECSRKKEGTPTFCDIRKRTGEYYA